MPRGTKKTLKKKPRARNPRKTAAKAKKHKVEYAKVPKQFEPMFARAQDFVSSYFANLKGDARHGTIEAGGERYLLVRAASMSVDFFKTIKDLYKGVGEEEALDVARNLLFDIAHSIGKADAKSFHKKMKLDDPVDRLSAGPIHFAYSGWAFVDIFPESRPTPDENYYLIYDHPYSFESAAWLKAKKKSSCPVCTMNAGYSSGWCEESFGVTLVAKEIMCKAAGDEACRFIMAPPSKIEEHISRYVKKKPALAKRVDTYEVPGFFKRKQIEQELQRAAEEWSLTFDSMADGVTIHTNDYTITNVNKTICAMLGTSKEKLIGKKCYQVFHGMDKPIDGCPLKSMLKSKRVERIEINKPSLGMWLAVSTSPVFDEIGNVAKIIHTIRDITVRKQMEEDLRAARNNMEQRVERRTAELKRSQQLYQTLAEAAEDYIYIIRPDMTVQYFNEFGIKALKCSRDEIVGKRLTELFSFDAPRRMEEAIGRVFSSGEARSAENPLQFPDGEIWLHTHLVPLKDEKGAVTGVMGLSRDITERKGYEERLRLTQTTMDHVGNAIYWMGPDARIVYVNDQACEQLGYSRKELLTMSVMDIDSTFFAKNTWQKHWADLKERKSFVVESQHKRKDGTTFPIEVMVNYLEHAGREFNCAIVLDITERKKAEAALRESERRFQQVAESAEEWIWEVNKHGLYTYSNEVVEEILGYKPEEIVGMMHFYDFFIPEDKEELKKTAFRVFEKKELFKGFENINVHKSGKQVILETSGSPVIDRDGKLIGYRGADTDITERKWAEEELKRAIKLKSDFMAMMSHELRTPLTRIIFSTHLVLRDRDAVLPDKRVNNLNSVLSSSDVLLLMINNVLEMARLEGGSVPVYNQECDLRHMVRASISGCEGMTEQKDIDIVTNIDDAAATIYTDKEKLGHIVMNLICNGIRYSDRGTIEITAKPSKIQGCVDIAVSDEGIGIPFEKMPHLFEPFKQLEEITKRHPGGIGLGLSIVKANLELIGGSIDVKSEVGKGSTFTVTIPSEPSEDNDWG